MRIDPLLTTTVIGLLIGGCASTSENNLPAPGVRATHVESSHPASAAALGEIVARSAIDQLGIPYQYGGADPERGFDCSGLVFYTFSQAGLPVPRTSEGLFKAAHKISIDDARSGDLLFFQDQAKLSHVGIFIGDGSFVHAPAAGRNVSMASLDGDYFRRQLVGVGRLLPD